MYQLEVKRWLVEHRFPPTEGWLVHVDVDAMERARGGSHRADKAERTRAAEEALARLGATIEAHPALGRVDIVAEHPDHGVVVVEVEGSSSRQREQAIYSALGQLLLQVDGGQATYMIAVPDEPGWERQLLKVPDYCKDVLRLRCLLVSEQGVREPARR